MRRRGGAAQDGDGGEGCAGWAEGQAAGDQNTSSQNASQNDIPTPKRPRYEGSCYGCLDEVVKQLEAVGLQGNQRKYRNELHRFWKPIFCEPRTKRQAYFWSYIMAMATLVQSWCHLYGVLNGVTVMDYLHGFDLEAYYSVFPSLVLARLGFTLSNIVKKQGVWEIRMMLQWRTTFSLMHAQYTADAYYHLSYEDSSLCPEALICENSFAMVQMLSKLQATTIQCGIELLSIVYICVRCRPKAILVGVCMAPFYLAIAGGILPMGRVLRVRHVMLDALMQFALGRVQDNAEQIALARGARAELSIFEGLLDAQWANIKKQAFMNGVFTLSLKILYLLLEAPGVLVALWDIRHGRYWVEAYMYWSAFHVVATHLVLLTGQAHEALLMEVLASRMSQLLDRAAALERRALHRHRLSQGLDSEAPDGARADDYLLVRECNEGPELELREVTLRCGPQAANPKVLFSSISLQVFQGQSLLVVGETGIGKTALLRSLYGIWLFGGGSVHRCPRESILSVPQRPYMYRASLRENLVYPHLENVADFSDGDLRGVLEAVNLGVELQHCGLDDVLPWHMILSLGQQQRLAIARSLLRPGLRLLLLDEATSALDLANEGRIYGLIRERFSCYVSIGHRPSIWQYHSHLLRLEPRSPEANEGARCSFRPLERSDIEAAPSLFQADSQEEEPEEDVRMPLATTPAAAELDPETIHGMQVVPELGINVLNLLRRALFDILVPIYCRKAFWDRIKFSVYRLLLGSFIGMTVLVQSWNSMRECLELASTSQGKGMSMIILRKLAVLGPMSAISAVLLVTDSFTIENAMFIELKRSLARRYLNSSTSTFYRVALDRKVENPVLRLTSWDLSSMLQWFKSLAALVVGLTLAVAYFLSLYVESPELGSLAVSVITVTFVGTAIILKLLWPIFSCYKTWIVYNLQVGETVVHVRGCADAVALMHGGRTEKDLAFRLLAQSVTGGGNFLWFQELAEFVTEFFFKFCLESGVEILTNELYLCGKLLLSQIMVLRGLLNRTTGQMEALCAMLVGNPSSYIGLARLHELVAEMDRIQDTSILRLPDMSTPRGSGVMLEEVDSRHFALELRDVALLTPVQFQGIAPHKLSKGISVQVPIGGTLVIVGESGIGKSSLLRAVVGLWCSGDGTLRRPPDSRAHFVAQRPYMCVGTLRTQLLYPRIDRKDVSDERLCAVLRAVKLERLLLSPGLDEVRATPFGRLDEMDRLEKAKIPGIGAFYRKRRQEYRPDVEELSRWWDRLSLGEMQLLGFARLLLREGLQLVFMDEATSALSPEKERALYELLQQRAESYVSVAHRPQVWRFHKNLMEIRRPEGSGLAESRVLPVADYEAELHP